jgi:hypothetical protein
MTLYIAYNCAIDATTGVMAGQSYSSGAKCAIQLAPPSGMDLRIVEWGVSSSATAPAAKTVYTLAQASAASTMTTAHSTTTIMPVSENTKTCPLTMGTGSSGFGTGAITTNTTERQFAGFLGDPTEHYEKQLPLGEQFIVQAGKFAQLRIATQTAYTIIGYIKFDI